MFQSKISVGNSKKKMPGIKKNALQLKKKIHLQRKLKHLTYTFCIGSLLLTGT